MGNKEAVIKEIEDIVRRQPAKLRKPMLDVSQKIMEYAETEIGFTMMQMRERISSLEQAVETISKRR
jgi:hypothetical protein